MAMSSPSPRSRTTPRLTPSSVRAEAKAAVDALDSSDIFRTDNFRHSSSSGPITGVGVKGSATAAAVAASRSQQRRSGSSNGNKFSSPSSAWDAKQAEEDEHNNGITTNDGTSPWRGPSSSINPRNPRYRAYGQGAMGVRLPANNNTSPSPSRKRASLPATRDINDDGTTTTTGGGGGAVTAAEGWTMPRRAPLRLPLLRSLLLPDSKTAERSPPRGSSRKSVESLEFETSLLAKSDEEAITFFARHGNSTPVKFVYCNRADTKGEFRPYDLHVVPRKELEPEYFTISSTGVVHVQPDQPSEFISLADWMHQSTVFNVLRSIPYFKHYLQAKCFRLWRANVRYKVYCKMKKSVQRNLFLARPSFCDSLIDVKRLMYDLEMDGRKLSSIPRDVLSEEKFSSEQAAARTGAAKKFGDTVAQLHEVVDRVCTGVKDRARQHDHGMAADDMNNSSFAQHLLGGTGRIKPMHAVKQERQLQLQKLKHAKREEDMLPEFIRLVDYMEVEHLVGLTTEKAAEFLSHLRDTERKKAFFSTTVKYGPTSLSFAPTAVEVKRTCALMLDGMVGTVDTVERVLEHGKFRAYVSNLLIDYPKVELIIRNDASFNLSKAGIEKTIDEDFALAERTVRSLEHHRAVFNFGEEWSFDAYCAKEHTVESIQADMNQQKRWNEALKKNIKEFYEAGIFQVQAKKLKNHLVPITTEALNKQKGLLLRICKEKCHELHEMYVVKIKDLLQEPTQLQAFATHVATFKKIQIEGKEMGDRVRKTETMQRLLSEFDVKIAPSEQVAFGELKEAVARFEDQLITTEQKIHKSMLAMQGKVYENIGKLTSALEEKKALLDTGEFADEKAAPHEVVTALENIVQVQLNEIKQQAEKMRDYQVLFGTAPHNFKQLPEVQSLYDRRYKFWKKYADWLDMIKLWNSKEFATLNVRDIDHEVTATCTIAEEFHRESASAPLTEAFLKSVQVWKTTMPLITQLGNSAIKATHWRALLADLPERKSMYYVAPEKIRLKQLWSWGLFEKAQLVNDVCEQAVEEGTLEANITKLERVWQTQLLMISPYQDNKDVFILGDEAKEVMSRLDEHQQLLQHMATSRFIAIVRDKVNEWDTRLRELHELLTVWLTCQRTWLTLEPVFSAADVQRQLPMEYKMYMEVDRFWKDTMRRTAAQPNAINTLKMPAILRQFIKYNKDLDKIKVDLSDRPTDATAAIPTVIDDSAGFGTGGSEATATTATPAAAAATPAT